MKYILVTGGVISGIGKGVISSSIGALLKGCGLHVTSIKIDPYLNIDAGTFSPYEHGNSIHCFYRLVIALLFGPFYLVHVLRAQLGIKITEIEIPPFYIEGNVRHFENWETPSNHATFCQAEWNLSKK